MRRPLPGARAVWVGIIGGAAALDYWCDLGDPDQDTLSEHVRMLVDKHPAGRHLFAVSCVAVPAWFYRHISKEWT